MKINLLKSKIREAIFLSLSSLQVPIVRYMLMI
jgi:hypothetical protein